MIYIYVFINKKITNGSLAYIYKQIWRIIDSFESCSISYTYEEGNSVVDHLLNLGCDEVMIVDHDMGKVLSFHSMLAAIIIYEQART